jgi:pyruvate/2-oxoglutarate dehydrogenase complex dihydrolipoamide acyltransferase (E2) component
VAKDVIMPVLGMSQDSGVLLKWLKGEGDEVTKGDILMEVETDKAVVEIEAQASGKLANISAQEGEDVPTGQVIASILEEGESPSEAQSQPEVPQAEAPQAEVSETEVSGDSTPASSETPAPSTSPSASTATSQQASRNGHAKILASPKAKRLARERDINLAAVLGTGPDTVIVARDVLEYTPTETSADVTTASSASPAESMPVVSAVFDDLQADVDVTALLGYLERTQQHLPEATLRHLLIRFCAAVLRKHPLGTDAVNIAVYALEHDQPTLISDAAKKSMAEIIEQTDETEGAATFEMHDFTDSGVARATRHPQLPASASLTLGHINQNQMTLTLTYDGTSPTRDAAAFIRTLSQLIQQPDDLIFLF